MSTARLMQMAAAGVDADVWTDPDLANASYDNVSFSVASQDGIPIAVVFRDNGEAMYIAGNGTDTVYQYSLSSPWGASSLSYASKSFSVASQETAVSGFDFSPDGTSFFVSGSGTDTIFQYSLSSPWDVSTASYSSKSFSVSSQDAAPGGVKFRGNGEAMYIAGGANDTIFQYSLSSPWDVSTASYSSKSFDVSSQDGNPKQMFFSPTGDKLWFIGLNTGKLYELGLSTDFDISTASYNSVNFSFASQDSLPTGVFFKPDGSKLYSAGISNDTIYQYSTD